MADQLFAVVIPCYNHGRALSGVLKRLEPFGHRVYVVDDGNCPEERALIEEALRSSSGVSLVTLDKNGGKGRAFMAGAMAAAADGCSHVVQLDADGQHAVEDLPRLTALSRLHQHEVICAEPVYDDSAPKARVYGRRITNFWMAVETMSRELRDGMCGFRVYPVAELLDLMSEESLSPRMGFDIDVLVRLKWRGVRSRFVKSAVTYPEDGVSNFKALRDNLAVSWVHTRLCFMALFRLPLMYLKGRGGRDHE